MKIIYRVLSFKALKIRAIWSTRFKSGFSGLYTAKIIGFFLRISSLNIEATNFSLIALCDRGYYARPEKGIGIWSRVPAHANQSSLRPSHNFPNQSAHDISVSKAQKGIFNQEKKLLGKNRQFFRVKRWTQLTR